MWVLPQALAADWQPATGPLKTRWAKDVSPAKVLPEYPRSQLVRKEWLNLNGLWDIKLGDGTEAGISPGARRSKPARKCADVSRRQVPAAVSSSVHPIISSTRNFPLLEAFADEAAKCWY